MKKTNKIIALILAMILAFSSVPLMASAAAIDDKVDTVDKLIEGENLGNLVEWLLKNINNRKEEITGTVLSLVFMFVEDANLQSVIGTTDIVKASDEELATILVTWLDTYVLPGLSNDDNPDEESDMEKTLKILSYIGIKVNSVNEALDSVYDVSSTLKIGNLRINGNALKNVKTGNGKNLKVVHAVLQFLADNTELIKVILKGELSFGRILDFGIKELVGLDINAEIKKVIGKDAIKEMLCKAIELDYETYKNYTADEIVAVAFLKLLTGKDKVEQEEAKSVMNLTIYEFLEEYAGKIYKNLLVEPLNTDVKNMLVENVKPLDDDFDNIFDKVFNWDYEFKETTFDEFLGKGKGDLVNQLNNAVITLLKVILTEDAFKALALEEGGNEKLEGNLTKAFRYILPIIAKIDKAKLGADLSGFTADAVKNMSTEEMAVGVLKVFFPGWFKLNDAAKTEVDKAKTLEQLAVYAAKFAASNKEWVPMDITAVNKAVNIETLDDAACLDLVFEIGMEVAAKALNYNKGTTYYELPADVSAWTGADYLDDIVDWALNFVDGLPASADGLSTERGKLDGEGGFFKLNVILDSLFDLSFISGCGNDLFAFDMETMLLDKFLGNLLNFDINEAVAILAENEESEIFNKKINKAAIDLVDDLLTGLFEETYEIPATYIIGDVNGDKDVTAADARLVLRFSVDLETFTEKQKKAAEVDGKPEKITAADARKILRASVDLETL